MVTAFYMDIYKYILTWKAIVHGLIENYQIDDAKVEFIDFSNHSNYYCRLMAQGIVHDQNRVLRHVRQHSKEYLQVYFLKTVSSK